MNKFFLRYLFFSIALCNIIVKINAVNECLSMIAQGDPSQAKKAIKEIRKQVEKEVTSDGKLKNKQEIDKVITGKMQKLIKAFKKNNVPLFTYIVLDQCNIQIANYLLPYVDQGSINTTFYRTAIADNLSMGMFLLKYTTPKMLNQALYLVASKGRLSFLSLLLSCSEVDVNFQNKNGNTALHAAILGDYQEATGALLLDERININIQNNMGNAPIHLAVEGDNIKIANSLIMMEALINLQNNDLNTPLHCASYMNNQAMIILLQQAKGIDLYKENIVGDTAEEVIIGNDLAQSVLSEGIDSFRGLFDKLKQVVRKKVIQEDKNITEQEITKRTNERISKKIDLWQVNDEQRALTLMEKAVRRKAREIAACLLPYTSYKVLSKVLYLATLLGDLAMLMLILADERVNAMIIDEDGNTLIHFAAYWDREMIMKFLLNKTNINPNLTNKKGLAAIHYATQKNCIAVLRILCNTEGIDVNIKTRKYQSTPLHIAVNSGFEESICLLIAHKDIDLFAKNINEALPVMLTNCGPIKDLLIEKMGNDYELPNQKAEMLAKIKALNYDEIAKAIKNKEIAMPPLIEAICNRETERALTIIKEDKLGEHINTKSAMASTTALMCSITLNNERVIKALLKKENMDVNAIDENGNTGIFYAVSEGHAKVVGWLLKRKDIDISVINKMDKNLLWITQYQQKCQESFNNKAGVELCKDIAKLLMNHYAQLVNEFLKVVNDCKENKKSLEKVKGLLQVYPDLALNRQSPYNNGGTLLMLTVITNSKKAVRVLLKIGADPTICNWIGDTPLIAASREGHIEVAKALLQYNSNLHQQNRLGYTAFQIACDQEDKAMASLLVNQQDPAMGYTPFMLDVAQNNINRVKWVLKNCRNVDVNKQTKLGNTAIMISIAKGNKAMTGLLVNFKKIDLDIANKQHLTALSIASNKLDSDIVKWILGKIKKKRRPSVGDSLGVISVFKHLEKKDKDQQNKCTTIISQLFDCTKLDWEIAHKQFERSHPSVRSMVQMMNKNIMLRSNLQKVVSTKV